MRIKKTIEVGGIKISEFLNPDWPGEKYVLDVLEKNLGRKLIFSPDEFVEILQKLAEKPMNVDDLIEKIIVRFSLTRTAREYRYDGLYGITPFVDGQRHGVAFGRICNGLPRDRAVYSKGIFIGDANKKREFENNDGLYNVGARTVSVACCLPGVNYLVYSISATEMCDDIVHGLFEVCQNTHLLINTADGHELGRIENDRFYYCRPIINFKGELLIE